MEKEEKRRKFHKALLSIFYPTPSHQDVEEEEEAVTMVHETSDLDFVPAVSNDSEDGDSPCDTSACESQKLTRAQRKRLRRKKLKEADSHRRKLIGPLLPSKDCSEDLVDNQSSSDPREVPISKAHDNAAQGLDQGIRELGESIGCTTESKIRRRRMAKRINSKTVERSSNVEASTQVRCDCSKDGEIGQRNLQ